MKPTRPYHGYTAYHREPGGLRRLDFFVDRLASWRGQRSTHGLRVLDIGCGNGNIALALAALGYAVTGVDGDAPSIAQARAQADELGLKTAHFDVGWTKQLVGRRFDAIIASEVLEHQPDPVAFLGELKDLLSPGGALLLSVPNGESFEESLRWFTTHTTLGRVLKRLAWRVARQESVQSRAASPHLHFWSWSRLVGLLNGNGWGIEHVAPAAAVFKEFFYLAGRLFMRRGSAAFHRLDAIDARWAERLPIARADGWLIDLRPFDASKPLVMHVLPTLAAGGAERVVHDVCARLPYQGYRALAVSVLRGGPLKRAFVESGVPFVILGKRGPFGIGAVLALRRLMRERRPAIVHTHLYGADVWGRVAAWFAGVPVRVMTEHNVDLHLSPGKRLLKRLLVPLTVRFVAVSHEVKRFMSQEEGVPAGRIAVITNGIDLGRAMTRPPGPFAATPRLIVVGRLVPQKGIDVLLRALSTIGAPWHLRVVGEGECASELKALAERLGLSPRIEWLGRRDDVPALLAASDVFCFPSRWEGLGLALVEAAAAGVPIVASDLMAFRDVLDPDEAALAQPDDPAALARVLTRVLADPATALARATALALRVRKVCSAEAMAAAYADLYRTLL